MSYSDTEYPWNKTEQWVPFDAKGNQQTWPEYSYEGTWGQPDYKRVPPKWTKNFTFHDTLTFVTYHRGRSAAHFEFRLRSTGTTVIFFISDFTESVIPHMESGVVSGTFTFRKQGANYGCVRIGD